MAIPTTILDDMVILVKFATLIEECQDKKLITSDERVAYRTALNGQIHTEIEHLIELLPPEA